MPTHPHNRAPDPEVDRRLRRLLASGHRPEAARLAAQTLRRHPDHPRALLVQGILARDGGDLPGAVARLERAAAAAPDDPEILFHLGLALMHGARERERARDLLERAVELRPGAAPPRVALAKVLEELNLLDAAAGHAAGALALDPDHAEALVTAAVIDRRRGELAPARARFESVLLDADRLKPLPPLTRATAWNQYAQTLERLGEHERAFDAFAAAQRERWSCPDARGINPARPLERLDRGRTLLTPERLRAWADFDPADGRPDPAFLAGFPRSGTTLTEQILAAHPAVVTIDELTPMTECIARLRSFGHPGEYPAGLERLTDDQVRDLRAHYWRVADERVPDRADRLLVDKLPLHLLHLPLLVRLFPRARLIVAVRDPRDACLSAFMQLMAPNDAMAHLNALPKAVRFYARVMGHYLAVRDALPMPRLESRYEDLVADPGPGARRLADSLGLPWDDAMLRHHERVRGKSISTPSYEAVAAPVHTGSRGRWRRHAARLAPHAEALRPFLDAFGYPPDEPPMQAHPGSPTTTA